MPSCELPELIWGNRAEPFFGAHPTTTRWKPLPREEALDGLRSGWKFFALVPRIAQGNRKHHCAPSFDCLWVDIDRPGVAIDQAVGDMHAALRPLELLPTAIVFSGNQGLHGYWKLDCDLPISEIEAFNRRLAALLGGDSCWDCTRILRNPGTTNEKSGRLVQIIEIGGEIIPTTRLMQVRALAMEPPGVPPKRSQLGSTERLSDCKGEWLRPAQRLTGWGELDLDLRGLPEWEKEYMVSQPAKGWRRHHPGCDQSGDCQRTECNSRSEVEIRLVHKLVGKQFGASDRQVVALADQYFPRHQDELPKRGYDYLNRMIDKARRRWYADGWITSPEGGWPKRRDVAFRVGTVDDLDAEYELASGQRLSEWVEELQGLGRSRSTAYRHKDRMEQSGLIEIRDERIYKTDRTNLRGAEEVAG